MGLDFNRLSRGFNSEPNETELNKDDLRSLKKNASGCNDPTAYEAIVNVMREEAEKERFHKLLKAIFEICELSDFHVEERIVVKDMRTGKIWR